MPHALQYNDQSSPWLRALGDKSREAKRLEAEIVDLKKERQRRNEAEQQQLIQKQPEKIVAEYKRRYGSIRSQIGNRAKAIDQKLLHQIDQLTDVRYKHTVAEPPKPEGLLGCFRKAAHKQWETQKGRINKRLDQLKKRRELIRDYMDDGYTTMYRHRGNRLADQKMKEAFPRMVKAKQEADRIVSQRRTEKLERKRIERVQKRQDSKYKGLEL